MKTQIKAIHSPDIEDLELYKPEVEDNFGFLLQLFVGPENAPGEESFDFMVCTPKWIAEYLPLNGVLMGRHYLFVQNYDYKALNNWLQDYVDKCTGETWNICVNKLSKLGKWEFED